MSGPRVRVLVVDDSQTSRALLGEVLGADPDVEVVGEAADGSEAVRRVGTLHPSLVVMDLRMPGMDGLAATEHIMAEHPTPIVVVTAGHDPRDVEVAMRALRAGALTVLPKPGGPGTAEFTRDAAHLRSMVKALADVRVVRRRSRDRPAATVDRLPRGPAMPGGTAAVGVVASTGGPVALQRLLLALKNRLPAPLLVVQHITDGFVEGLASWLASTTGAAVRVATHGVPLERSVTYLAPDDRHLEVARDGRVVLSHGPPVGGFRPSGTELLRSVAACYAERSAAVILTGMGVDGLDGARAVHAARGLVLAQDADTSVVFGMPKAVVEAGVADEVGPVEQLASRLLQNPPMPRPL